MPGYNHRLDCQCGWCVGRQGTYSPRTKPNTAQLDNNYKIIVAARETLRKLNVSNYSSCFVNPNAQCPVCGQAVFFYSNIHGSRVFFNELGPPWEKHGCTDNSGLRPHQSSRKSHAPVRRSKNQIQDIANAARIVGSNTATKTFRNRTAKWVLCVVLQAIREGSKISVVVETLSPSTTVESKFAIYCDEDIINEGDLVSNKGHLYSFVRRDSLANVSAVEGQVFGEINLPKPDADKKIIPNSMAEMQSSEKRHFNSEFMSSKAIEDKYAPILKSFSNRRIVGPRNVSHYLNEIGHKTAIGEHWTPRLAFFLIKILGAPMEKHRKGSSNNRITKIKRPLKKKRSQRRLSKINHKKMSSIAQIEDKLSKLGKVTRVSKQDTDDPDK